MRTVFTFCLLVSMSFLIGCGKTQRDEYEQVTIVEQHENEPTTAPARVESLTVPEGCTSLIMVPERYDPWVFRQDARRLFLLSGTGVAIAPGSTHILNEPIEFHVGNRFFFSEGLGLRGETLDKELDVLLNDKGEPPFVLTAGNQNMKSSQTISIPTGFKGWAVFLRPTGTESAMCNEVEPIVRPVSNPTSKD
jgi:hypothetical protein